MWVEWTTNFLFLVHSTHTYLPMNMEQSVPKRRHLKSRRRVITQKKAYNLHSSLHFILHFKWRRKQGIKLKSCRHYKFSNPFRAYYYWQCWICPMLCNYFAKIVIFITINVILHTEIWASSTCTICPHSKFYMLISI